MTTADRNTEMTTIEQAGDRRTAPSPFFIAAIGVTVALVVVAGVIALLS